MEPRIKNGWLRAILFMPIWFFAQAIVQGFGFVAIMISSGVNMEDPAAVEAFGASMQGMGFGSPMMLLMTVLGIISSFGAIWFMMAVVNREPLMDIGLSVENRGKEMLAGVGGALLFIGGIFLILWVLGAITVTGSVGFKAEVFMVSLMLFIAAFNEEIVFRGYLLKNMMDETDNRWIALAGSSVFFALVHSSNPSVWSTWVPMTELFAAGFILGISYTFTKNLWLPTFFHFGWNFFQGLFGFEISGMGVDSWKVIAHENTGNIPDIISGGDFGIEGSIISLSLTILGTYLIFKYYNDKQ
ncbi:CPBP family intramembrane metalloprotease [Candidatus Marinimicrobia bacterium]|nr:CPBP family intramembrane metalloprotease [Candidatus Neomarinimicrobiota bacterium]